MGWLIGLAGLTLGAGTGWLVGVGMLRSATLLRGWIATRSARRSTPNTRVETKNTDERSSGSRWLRKRGTTVAVGSTPVTSLSLLSNDFHNEAPIFSELRDGRRLAAARAVVRSAATPRVSGSTSKGRGTGSL